MPVSLSIIISAMHQKPEMKKVMLVGSFLSKQLGTRSQGEKVADLLADDYQFKLVSGHKNRALRLIDIILNLLFLRFDYSCIEVFSDRAFNFARIAVFISHIRRKKIMLIFHGGRLAEFYREKPNIFKSLFKYTSNLYSPSTYLINEFSSWNIQIKHLPNFINLHDFPYRRDSFKRHSILWVRAFSELYNPLLAIEVLRLLSHRYEDATLTMIGPDKGYLARVEKQIEQYDLQGKVAIQGSVENSLLHSYYSTHHVFINTTSYESFGVSVLEAAACGIPIVTTKVGELPFMWLDKSEILFVESLDEHIFCNQIITVFEDEGLANSLSSEARKKALTFNRESAKKYWLDALAELNL